MRVAVVVSTYPPYKGGMGNVARDHVDALRAAGHEVTVLAPGSGLRPLLRIGNAAVVPQLLWRLRGFDAVELHYPFFGGAEWTWLWRMLFGRRTRFAIYYHMDTIGRGLLGAVFTLYRKLLLGPILASADVVMASSLDYFASSPAAGLVTDTKLREVPLGVDAERYRPEPDGRRPEPPTALFVGALDRAHYFKGVGLLLEAFARVLVAVPDAKLVVVGDGDLRADYERAAIRLGVDARVWFAGKVPDERHPHCFHQADVHVLPSVDRSEAFGLVTLEAASSGIPSIVSDLPGVRSVVEEGTTGLRVPPGDAKALSRALTDLLLDRERARRMGAAARERVLGRYARAKVDRLLLEALSR